MVSRWSGKPTLIRDGQSAAISSGIALRLAGGAEYLYQCRKCPGLNFGNVVDFIVESHRLRTVISPNSRQMGEQWRFRKIVDGIEDAVDTGFHAFVSANRPNILEVLPYLGFCVCCVTVCRNIELAGFEGGQGERLLFFGFCISRNVGGVGALTVIVRSAGQPWNDARPIVVVPTGKDTDVSSVQFMKAPSLTPRMLNLIMFMTWSGSSISPEYVPEAGLIT